VEFAVAPYGVLGQTFTIHFRDDEPSLIA